MSNKALNNPQKPGIIEPEKKSASISESNLLVPLAKSKKLAAIRKQLQSHQPIKNESVNSAGIALPGLNKEANRLLNEAQGQINAKIAELMARYPPGMKNKMFALKYGSPESIKELTMKAIFTRLAIVKPKKFALIESLDYLGNDTT